MRTQTIEPNLQTASAWWSELPAKWTPFGWKDHIFRFNVLYNGLIVAIPNLNPRTKKYAGQGCMLGVVPLDRVDFPGHVKDPQDNGSVIQGWSDHPAPVLWSEWAMDGILFREEVFAHVPGGGELERGDEPLFAWIRLSIHDTIPGLPVPETWGFSLNLNAPYIETGAMSIRYNLAILKDKSRYPRALTPDTEDYRPDTGLRFLEPDGRVRLAIAPGHEGTVVVRPGEPSPDDFLIHLGLRVEKGAHADLLLPMLPADRDVFDAELALGYDRALDEANRLWSATPETAAVFETPERQINEGISRNLKLSRVIAELEPETHTYTLLTGSWAYSDVWSTPAAMQCVMLLDNMGYHAEAEKYLRPYIEHQGTVLPKGDCFAPHPGSLGPPAFVAACVWTSDHGALLWALAEHAMTTGDPGFIAFAAEPIVRACEFVGAMRRIEGHRGIPGLLPPGMATDMPTEIQSVWADGWNYKGLHTAARFLRRIGHPRAAEFEAEAADYRTTFRRALAGATAEMPEWTDDDGHTHQIVPLAVFGAQPFEYRNAFYLDTGPLMLVFSGLCDAAEDAMRSTVKWFREGPPSKIYRYDSDCWQVPSLHREMSSCEPCFSWNVFHSHQLKDRQHFLEGLYSLFAGSMSRQTQTVCETRGGITGVIGAHLPTCLARLAVVDDQVHENELHVLRLIPLAWLREDQEAVFERMPTHFGPVSLRVSLQDSGRTLAVDYHTAFRTPPARVVLHVPPVPDLERIRLNQSPLPWDGSSDVLPLPL